MTRNLGVSMDAVIWTAIIGQSAAIIYLYVWVFRTVNMVKDRFYAHESRVDQHVDVDNLVYRNVCELQVQRFNEKIDENQRHLSDKIGEIGTKLDDGMKEIRQVLRN